MDNMNIFLGINNVQKSKGFFSIFSLSIQNTVTMHKNSSWVFGPYVSLKAGWYCITFFGTGNMNKASYGACHTEATVQLPMYSASSSNNWHRFFIYLSSDVNSVEFLMKSYISNFLFVVCEQCPILIGTGGTYIQCVKEVYVEIDNAKHQIALFAKLCTMVQSISVNTFNKYGGYTNYYNNESEGGGISVRQVGTGASGYSVSIKTWYDQGYNFCRCTYNHSLNIGKQRFYIVVHGILKEYGSHNAKYTTNNLCIGVTKNVDFLTDTNYANELIKIGEYLGCQLGEQWIVGEIPQIMSDTTCYYFIGIEHSGEFELKDIYLLGI